jgi:hypothetical protein
VKVHIVHQARTTVIVFSHCDDDNDDDGGGGGGDDGTDMVVPLSGISSLGSVRSPPSRLPLSRQQQQQQQRSPVSVPPPLERTPHNPKVQELDQTGKQQQQQHQPQQRLTVRRRTALPASVSRSVITASASQLHICVLTEAERNSKKQQQKPEREHMHMHSGQSTETTTRRGKEFRELVHVVLVKPFFKGKLSTGCADGAGGIMTQRYNITDTPREHNHHQSVGTHITTTTTTTTPMAYQGFEVSVCGLQVDQFAAASLSDDALGDSSGASGKTSAANKRRKLDAAMAVVLRVGGPENENPTSSRRRHPSRCLRFLAVRALPSPEECRHAEAEASSAAGAFPPAAAQPAYWERASLSVEQPVCAQIEDESMRLLFQNLMPLVGVLQHQKLGQRPTRAEPPAPMGGGRVELLQQQSPDVRASAVAAAATATAAAVSRTAQVALRQPEKFVHAGAYLPSAELRAVTKRMPELALNPKLRIDRLDISAASLVVTVRAVMPGTARAIRLDLDRSPLTLSAVSLRDVCTSVDDLGKELAVSE